MNDSIGVEKWWGGAAIQPKSVNPKLNQDGGKSK